MNTTTSRATQRLAEQAVDAVADGVDTARERVAPSLVRMAEQAESLLERGVDAVRDGTQQLRESAGRSTDRTVAYIRDEPLKSVLIAAAAGAALMALANVLGRSRTPR